MSVEGAARDRIILDVRDLSVRFRSLEGSVFVLDRARLQIPAGAVMGLVGESGCGKSTLVRAVLGILPHTAEILSGELLFDGENLLRLGEVELARRIRARRIAFIPQDPFLALNPVFTIGTQLMEIMRWHSPALERGSSDRAPSFFSRYGGARRRQDRERLIELFRLVQLPDPTATLDKFPHEFSGGQRQRLLIAAALACDPELIVADEPTTALDVTTQQQILALLDELATRLHLSVLFVTHDFGVVSQLCSHITVMYAGQTVETGTKRDVLAEPKHPYTQLLIACHPDRSRDLTGIPGSVPPLNAPPTGCRFHPRCPVAEPACPHRQPDLVETGSGHGVSCIHYDSRAPAARSPDTART